MGAYEAAAFLVSHNHPPTVQSIEANEHDQHAADSLLFLHTICL
jgi:hypothetical protein